METNLICLGLSQLSVIEKCPIIKRRFTVGRISWENDQFQSSIPHMLCGFVTTLTLESFLQKLTEKMLKSFLNLGDFFTGSALTVISTSVYQQL